MSVTSLRDPRAWWDGPVPQAFPETINVGGVPFRCVAFNADFVETNQVVGLFTPDEACIGVYGGLPFGRFVEVFFHELHHAAMWMSGASSLLAGKHRPPGGHEEQVVESVTRAFLTLFHANPSILKLMQDLHDR